MANAEAGFNAPRKPRDGWAASLFEKHELSQAPSLEAIEPVVKELWPDPASRIEAVELVFGRRVDAREFKANRLLGLITLSSDADQAFGGLLMLNELDQPPQAK